MIKNQKPKSRELKKGTEKVPVKTVIATDVATTYGYVANAE